MGTIKRILAAVCVILALNFLAIVGAALYLWSSTGMDGDKIAAIGQIVFPEDPVVEGQLATPEDEVAPTSLDQLETLLSVDPMLSASARVDAVEEAFTNRLEQLDRRRRELRDLRAQLRLAQENLLVDRTAVAERETELQAAISEAQRLANDAGFQDTLKLYEGMKARQVKDVFLDLDDETIVAYLEAMNPRTANKILAEFKSPGEVVRVRSLMELMRRKNEVAQLETNEGAGL